LSNILIKKFITSSNITKSDFSSLPTRNTKRSPLENDALFHLPFLAMAILSMSRTTDKYKPTTGNIGELIGQTFERTFIAFKHSDQKLSWSANLRKRTALAITFLESAELIIIKNNLIICTIAGKNLVNSVLKEKSKLGLAVRGINNNYINIISEKEYSQDLL